MPKFVTIQNLEQYNSKINPRIQDLETDIGQVVDPATHMPIEATKTSAGVVQLATAQDITNGTAGKVVDAQELINFAQTLPAANGITDVSSGDNSNQIVVSKFGGNKTLTIDNVEHADNADEATHATQADTAASANSVAWNNVSGKPSSYTPSSHTHDDRYYTESEIDTKLSGKANSSHTHDDRYYTESEIDTKLSGKSDTTHNHNSAYLGITAKAESAKSADSVAWANVSGKPTKVSQFTNDSGYITSSGTAATISQKVDSSAKTHTNYNTNGTHVPTMNFLSFWNGAYASSGASNLTYCAQGTIIGSNNIGSQSVNYANSAGSVAWGNVSGKPSTYTPSSHTHDDRYYTESEINTKLSNLLLQIYPVGSIYISASSTNPGTLFGGTWKALDQGRVLIGANSTYKAGTTGGEFTHTITTGEMPSHTHTGTTGNESAGHTHSGTTGNQSAGHTHTWSGTTSSDGSHAHTASSNSTGSHSHNKEQFTIAGWGQKNSPNNVYINATVTTDPTVGNWTTIGSRMGDAGSHSHTITVNSNGAHTHTVSGTTGGISANHNHSFTTGGISAHHNHSFTTGASGSGSAMNNMQPYLSVYMWQRTA